MQTRDPRLRGGDNPPLSFRRRTESRSRPSGSWNPGPEFKIRNTKCKPGTPASAGVTWGGGVIPSKDGIQVAPFLKTQNTNLDPCLRRGDMGRGHHSVRRSIPNLSIFTTKLEPSLSEMPNSISPKIPAAPAAREGKGVGGERNSRAASASKKFRAVFKNYTSFSLIIPF